MICSQQWDFLIVARIVKQPGSVFKIPGDCESSGNDDKDLSARSIINLRNRRGN